jgi:hypothetical protein
MYHASMLEAERLCKAYIPYVLYAEVANSDCTAGAACYGTSLG